MSCALRGCKSSRKKKYNEEGISFHRVPKSTTPIGEKWLDFMRHCENDPDWLPKKGATLCGKHFLPDSFYSDDRRTYLKESAVPTEMCESSISSKKRRRNVKPMNPESAEKKVPTDPNAMVSTDECIDITEDISNDTIDITDFMRPSPSSDVAESLINGELKKVALENNAVSPASPSSTISTDILSDDPDLDCTKSAPESTKPDPINSYTNLLVENQKLERTVARLQKLGTKRLNAIKALRASNRRFREGSDNLREKLSEYQKEKNRPRNIIMGLVKNPLVKQFMASQRLFRGRQIMIER